MDMTWWYANGRIRGGGLRILCRRRPPPVHTRQEACRHENNLFTFLPTSIIACFKTLFKIYCVSPRGKEFEGEKTARWVERSDAPRRGLPLPQICESLSIDLSKGGSPLLLFFHQNKVNN